MHWLFALSKRVISSRLTLHNSILVACWVDVMITENLPLIGSQETVREAIFCMTSGRLGLAIIVDGRRLLGILTDGDLHSMVSDAEILMRKYKIRALVVTDSRENAQDEVCGLLEIFADTE